VIWYGALLADSKAPGWPESVFRLTILYHHNVWRVYMVGYESVCAQTAGHHSSLQCYRLALRSLEHCQHYIQVPLKGMGKRAV
jgi:hypothetical protein